MKTEYLGISNEHKTIWQKSFLQTQLELLQIANNLEIFKQMRKEEFLLKIAVKNKIEETHLLLTELEKKLPKTQYKIETPEERKRTKMIQADMTLQNEIEAIRNKIEELQGGM